MEPTNRVHIHVPEYAYFGIITDDAVQAAKQSVEVERGVEVHLSCEMQFSDEVNLAAQAIEVFVGSNSWAVVRPIVDSIINIFRNAPAAPYPSQQVIYINGDNNTVHIENHYFTNIDENSPNKR